MEQSFLIKTLLMLIMAMVFIAIYKRVGFPVILAYLTSGVISGPSGFNWFNQNQIQSVAELGVVLLMFSLGLEFSLPRLSTMRTTVFGLGSAQVTITAALGISGSLLFGLSLNEAIVIGAVIALSSTAIVIKLLNEYGGLRQRHGELSVSVLLFQDLIVVPLLILMPLLASGEQILSWQNIAFSAGKSVLAVTALLVFGKWILPKLFDEVARSRTHELFVLSTLVVALTTGAFTQWLGLSMALGAFIAGMLLAESQYKRQLMADIRPFKDLLLGLFFISIGMLLDFRVAVSFWWQILLLTIVVIASKALIVFILFRIAKEPFRTAVAGAISLAQVGEFSFVVLALAVNYQLLDITLSTKWVMVAVLSMAVTPWLVRHSADIARQLQEFNRSKSLPTLTNSIPTEIKNPDELVLILGYGRVGQTIARFIKSESIDYLALDHDPTRVSEARRAGEPVYFGDAVRRAILKQVQIDQVKLIVVTFNSPEVIEEVLPLCRHLAPRAKILVRTRKDEDINALEKAGASLVIPEILEGSLMLVSQVLYRCGVPLSRIFKRIESERRNHYQYLHGFFSGEESDFTIERLSAVALPETAKIIGSTLADIPWGKLKVELRAIRREGTEIENPRLDWQIESTDILIILGKPRCITKAEQFLWQER